MHLDIEFEPLDLFNLIIIFFFLIIILLANHLMMQKTKKTLDHIDAILDQESERDDEHKDNKHWKK